MLSRKVRKLMMEVVREVQQAVPFFVDEPGQGEGALEFVMERIERMLKVEAPRLPYDQLSNRLDLLMEESINHKDKRPKSKELAQLYIERWIYEQIRIEYVCRINGWTYEMWLAEVERRLKDGI